MDFLNFPYFATPYVVLKTRAKCGTGESPFFFKNMASMYVEVGIRFGEEDGVGGGM